MFRLPSQSLSCACIHNYYHARPSYGPYQSVPIYIPLLRLLLLQEACQLSRQKCSCQVPTCPAQFALCITTSPLTISLLFYLILRLGSSSPSLAPSLGTIVCFRRSLLLRSNHIHPNNNSSTTSSPTQGLACRYRRNLRRVDSQSFTMTYAIPGRSATVLLV